MKLKDLPQPIRELAEKRIREQGNEPNEELNIISEKIHGGFNWDETEEGYVFWGAIKNGDFNKYIGLHPYEYAIKQLDKLELSDLEKAADYLRMKIEKIKQK